MLNLPRNIVFNDRGEFYNDDDAEYEIEELYNATDNNGVIFRVRGGVFAHYYILSNVECITESSYFDDLMDKKMSYIHLFLTLPSQQSGNALTAFLKSVTESMLLALKYADKLYWQLPKNVHIRSEYSLDYCLLQGMKIAKDVLRLENIVSNINAPEEIVKENLADDFDAHIRDRNRAIGKDVADAAKTKKKKTVKNKSVKNKN